MHAHPGLDVAILSTGRSSARSGVRRAVVLLGAAPRPVPHAPAGDVVHAAGPERDRHRHVDLANLTAKRCDRFRAGRIPGLRAQGYGEADGDRTAVGAELAACGRRDFRTAGLDGIRRTLSRIELLGPLRVTGCSLVHGISVTFRTASRTRIYVAIEAECERVQFKIPEKEFARGIRYCIYRDVESQLPLRQCPATGPRRHDTLQRRVQRPMPHCPQTGT
jgi:hypothetical protein